MIQPEDLIRTLLLPAVRLERLVLKMYFKDAKHFCVCLYLRLIRKYFLSSDC